MKEDLRIPEIPRSEYYPTRLLIFGRPGTGQSALAEELARRSGIQLYRAGQLIRERVMEATGEEIIGHLPTDTQDNRDIDSEIRAAFLEATSGSKIIIDAKLSSVIAREIQEELAKQGEEPPEFTGILVVAKADIRYRRIRERQIHKHTQNTGLSRKDVEKQPQFSLKAIRAATLERERGIKTEWEQNHPQIRGIDIFNPVNKDAQGKPIFHFSINTTGITVEESADLVEAILLSRYLDQQRRIQNILPKNGVIFEA